ncbi:hypothetical protein, partial [Nocardia cyriacigeorgica]|uniref:hypothetical protein n=1 Tax=Nocardia cyriacigeorgica TaxID=135487 RepID=UPI002457DA61
MQAAAFAAPLRDPQQLPVAVDGHQTVRVIVIGVVAAEQTALGQRQRGQRLADRRLRVDQDRG